MFIIYVLLIIIAIGVFLISEQGRQVLRSVSKWGLLYMGVIFGLAVIGGIVAYVIHNPSAQPLAVKLSFILLVLPFLKRSESESMEKLTKGVQKNDPRAIRNAYWLNKFVQAGLWFIGLWIIVVFILGFFLMLDVSILATVVYVLGIGGIFSLIYFLYEKEKHNKN